MSKIQYLGGRWWERPLICLLGFHDWRLHPSGGGVLYCQLCNCETGWH
jgi:hypothetical protein